MLNIFFVCFEKCTSLERFSPLCKRAFTCVASPKVAKVSRATSLSQTCSLQDLASVNEPQISKVSKQIASGLLCSRYQRRPSKGKLLLFFSFLLQWPFTVLIKQTRQAVQAVKQSIYSQMSMERTLKVHSTSIFIFIFDIPLSLKLEGSRDVSRNGDVLKRKRNIMVR